MLLAQGRELFLDPKPSLCDALDEVLEVLGSGELDLLLFGPPHVMRPEETIESDAAIQGPTETPRGGQS